MPDYKLTARLFADRLGIPLTHDFETEAVAFLREAWKDGYAAGKLDGTIRGLDIADDEATQRQSPANSPKSSEGRER